MMGLEILAKTVSLASALLTGVDVSREQLQARLAVCRTCDKVVQKGAIMRCGICDCSVGESGLVNLARYQETGRYGCKHPEGSQWIKNDC